MLNPYLKNGRLDLKFIIEKFQLFMREHYSSSDTKFLEREGRLVFMSFMRPLINGKGFIRFDDKEIFAVRA